MDVQELLDEVKTARGLTTDSALADALGVSKQAVSNWRQGRNTPDPVQCAAIAGYTGLPLGKVLGIIGEARAISREEKAVWRKLAATAALLTVMVFPGMARAAHAVTGWVSNEPVVCIMRNYG